MKHSRTISSLSFFLAFMALTTVSSRPGNAELIPQNQLHLRSDQTSSLFSQRPNQAAMWFVPTASDAPTRGRTRGGASRGNCSTSAADGSLIALVPLTMANEAADSESEYATMLSLTSLEHPSFWFYLPLPLSSNSPAEFLLLDEDGNYIYTLLLDNTDSSGVIKVDLPQTVSLADGKTYRWIFQMVCEDGNPMDIWGEIQRVTLSSDLQAQLAQASERDRAAIYAANGIWQDALTTLAELYSTNPTSQEVTADWESLLRSANIEEVANYPLLACCTAE